MKEITSTNRLLLLQCLIGILLAESATGSKQCEVMGVNATADEANSTFVYNIIYKDPSCTNKGKLRTRLAFCNGSTAYTFLQGDDIVHNCVRKGMWMVTVSQNKGPVDTVNSTCFSCLGLRMEYIVNFIFDFELLRITVQNIHPAVDNWSLTTYKTTIQSDYFSCHKYTSMEEIHEVFQKTHLQPQNISRTQIMMRQAFDPHACYCFVMSPISHLNLEPYNFLFTTKDCKPIPASSEDGVSQIDDLLMPSWEAAQLGTMLLVILLLLATIVFTLCNTEFFGKILGLKRQTDNEAPSKELMASCNSEVLLLYAPDISGSEDFAKFKKNLQAVFKVYDLFDRYDYNRIADQCGWVQNVMMPSSGKKLLLVESTGMLDTMNSLLKSDLESPGLAKVTQKSLQDKIAESLLTLALRIIISTNIRQNYSTVFVVRFSDEERGALDLLVQMRRYIFPNHFSELLKDMKEAKCNNNRKEVV